MTVMVDSMEVLLSYLGSQAGLVAAVSSSGKKQIYGPPGLPDQWVLAPALVCLRQSGTPNDDLPLMYQTYQIRCYAPKPWQASSLWTLLYATLHRLGVQKVPVAGGMALLQYGQMVSGPDDGIEPEVYWPYVMGLFLLHIGERTVS